MADLKSTSIDGDLQVNNGLIFSTETSIFYDSTTDKISFKIDGVIVATLDTNGVFNIDELIENKNNE